MRSGITNNYKNVKCYFVVALILFLFFIPKQITYTYATENTQQENTDIQQDLQQNISNTLDDLDLSQIEQYFYDNQEYYNNVFGVADYKEFLYMLINGEILTDFGSVFNAIITSIKEHVMVILSPLLLILVIILISVVFKSIRPKINASSVSEAIFFICFAVIVSILIMLFASVLKSVSGSVTQMQNQMNSIFPVLLLLMSTAGGVASVKAYQPLVLLLSNMVSNVFINILLPIVIVIFVLSLVGNISPQTKVKNLTDFFSSAFKWVIGIMFTVYMAFMSIQGITASGADGISIKTAKYAIRNYIPMLGGYISEGFEVARVGANIIKNAVGFSGIIIIILTILSPIILVGVLQLSLKLVSELVEPLSDTRATNLLTASSKSLSLLMVVVIGVAIMYFVIIFLLMCSVSGVV